jgi:uncharacterized protein (TIGR02996 family)
MTQEDAFLQAIRDNPEDDTVRLIYADWLQDHGEPAETARAELIRVQCGLARRGDGPERLPLRQREQELLHRHLATWVRPLRRLGCTCTFERGFITGVRVEARKFLTGADRLFQVAPLLNRLELYWGAVLPHERARLTSHLVACPYLSRLRHLDLSNNYLGSVGAQALAVCDHFSDLASLNLHANHIGDGGARALSGAPWLATIGQLNLSHNDIGPGGVRSLAAGLETLAERGAVLALRTLDLGDNRLGAAGQRVVMESTWLRRLARL